MNLERLARRAAAGDLVAARSLVERLEARGVEEPEGLPPGTLDRLAGVLEGVANGGPFRPDDLNLAAGILRGLAPKERPVQPLEEPLSIEAMREAVEAGRDVRGVVRVDLHDVISASPDSFLDMLSRLLTGSELLSDVGYKVVGAVAEVGGVGGDLLIEVSGDPTQIVDVVDAFDD